MSAWCSEGLLRCTFRACGGFGLLLGWVGLVEALGVRPGLIHALGVVDVLASLDVVDLVAVAEVYPSVGELRLHWSLLLQTELVLGGIDCESEHLSCNGSSQLAVSDGADRIDGLSPSLVVALGLDQLLVVDLADFGIVESLCIAIDEVHGIPQCGGFVQAWTGLPHSSATYLADMRAAPAMLARRRS